MMQTADIMGMPVKIDIVETQATIADTVTVFDYFRHIDEVFSPYKPTSEISQINNGLLAKNKASQEVQQIFALCDQTSKDTNGYFSMEHNGKLDPSGIVKGYAIYEGTKMLAEKGYKNFFVEIAGDAQVAGTNEKKEPWRIGIQNPFDPKEIIKVVSLSDKGIATSGNYMRGQHIYNPLTGKSADEIASITVIGPNVYEADRMATAAFAMGEKGILFIEGLEGFEGYMVTKEKQGIMTSGFEGFVVKVEDRK